MQSSIHEDHHQIDRMLLFATVIAFDTAVGRLILSPIEKKNEEDGL